MTHLLRIAPANTAGDRAHQVAAGQAIGIA
jgi:hypothetical protein